MEMLAVQRVFTTFLLPPGIFVLLLVVSSLFFYHRQRNLAIFNVFLGVSLWLVSIGPIAAWIVAPLEKPVELIRIPTVKTDAIVLLGGGIYDGVPDLSGTSAPTEDMLSRIVCTVRLYRQLQIPILISGGTPPEFESPEALVVSRFLQEMGVPKEQIVIDDKSRDTRENARNVGVICKRQGFRNLIVVTSAYHARRVSLVFENYGLNVTIIPSNFRAGPKRNYGWAAYLPAAEPVETIWRAGREYIGLAYYELILILKNMGALTSYEF